MNKSQPEINKQQWMEQELEESRRRSGSSLVDLRTTAVWRSSSASHKMTTSLPLLLLKNQFTVVTNECVTASFYCLGGVGRGREGQFPRTQPASSAKRPHEKYFTTSDHKNESSKVCWMDQQQPIATHFCRLGCQLVLDIFTELYKLDILHYITLHIIAVNLRSWRLGATMEVYLTENRTVCGRPTCRLSGRRGVRWELYCFAPPPRVPKILVVTHFRRCIVYTEANDDCCWDKKLSYRRGTTRCVVSVEILPTATQQCRNYLYDKSWTKYQLSLIDLCDKIVL